MVKVYKTFICTADLLFTTGCTNQQLITWFCLCFHCFDIVGWASARASIL